MLTDKETSSFPFLRLPLEIQRAICAELCVHCGYSDWDLSVEFFDEMKGWISNYEDLANLSRVSHILQALAQPFLYHIFPSRQAGRFLRTIFERPDLASCVKIFRGCKKYNLHEAYGVSLSYMYAGRVDEAKCYIDVGRALNLGGNNLNLEYLFGLNAEDLERSGSEFDYSAPELNTYYVERYDKLITSCVLALCPNLQYACIRESSSTTELESTHPLSFQFLDARLKETETIGRHGNTFTSLETLVVEWPYRHSDQSLGLERLRIVLDAAPNLQRLLLIGGRGKYNSPFSVMPPLANIANLRELRLCAFRCSTELIVPYTAITKAANHCQTLETFEFEAISYQNTWTAPNPFSPIKLLQSLLPVQQSLTTLIISSRHILITSKRDNITIGPILRQFYNLKILELDEQCFCSHWIDSNDGGHSKDYTRCLINTVPPTVQILTIILHDKFRAIQDIVAFGCHVAAHGPASLRTLRVAFFHGRAQTEDVSLQASAERCLADCLYCDCDYSTAMERLDAMIRDVEPLIVTAFKDTDINMSIYKTHSENMVYHILVLQ